MIIQALDALYGRLAQDPETKIPPAGFSAAKVHHALVLNAAGELLAVQDVQDRSGKKPAPRTVFAPEQETRTSGVKAYFLCDKTAYVLGADDGKGKAEKLPQQFAAFKALHAEVTGDADDMGLLAVSRFLEAWTPDRAAALPGWHDVAGKNLVFRLDGDDHHQFIHDRPAARQAWLRHCQARPDSALGFCLARGMRAPIATLHNPIKGVYKAQTSGAFLVSFNQNAFTSHGKEQNHNAPVCEEAAFAYATALNHLLRRDSTQRIQIGDATTVFWTERPAPMTTALVGLVFSGGLEQQDKEQPDDAEASQTATPQDPTLLHAIRLALTALRDGKKPVDWDDEPDIPFYILGLSPNNARLAVRFWHVSTVGDITARLAQHFQDIAMEKQYPRDPEFPGAFRLLVELAPQKKADNIPRRLSGELASAIFSGGAYPLSLLSRLVGRIRADGDVSYLRAAMIKGLLVRRARLANHPEEETVSLDEASTNIGYRLGRLFAVLEKAQLDALGKVNSTIKDRFYGAASATPRAVFPRLIRLAQHHIAKAEYGARSDKAMGAVLEDVREFPAHLSLEDQGRFALGYYQQRNALYAKKKQTA